MATLLELQAKIGVYKNTLVIGDNNNIVRLVDVIDGHEDFYWVYDTKKGIIHSSCVGGWVALKGFILDKDYKRLVSIWNLNI